MHLSDKVNKKARKARNQTRRASVEAEKQAIALREVGIPEVRWPSAPVPSTPRLHAVLYDGRPALVDLDMADDAEPVPFTHHRLNVAATEKVICPSCSGSGDHPDIPDQDCWKCLGTKEVDHLVEPAGPYIAETGPNERPSFYAVSPHTYRQLRALASLPPPMPDAKKVFELPKGGIEQTRIEVTGLGRGGVASFKRCPNKALKHYLARSLITQKQYDAGMELYFVFEEANIPPGMTMDLTRDFTGGGGWRDFMPARLDTHRRLETLFKAVEGKTARQMIYDVCCLGRMLTEGSYGHFKDTRAKMACLKEALDDLRSLIERTQRR